MTITFRLIYLVIVHVKEMNKQVLAFTAFSYLASSYNLLTKSQKRDKQRGKKKDKKKKRQRIKGKKGRTKYKENVAYLLFVTPLHSHVHGFYWGCTNLVQLMYTFY